LLSEGLMALNRDDRVRGVSTSRDPARSVLTRASVVKIGEALDAEQVIFGRSTSRPFPNPAAKAKDRYK